MNLDRYMVTLFFEIRRNLPASKNSQLKISAPDLGERMVELYRSTNDENTLLLIEIFLDRAGDGWLERAKPTKKFYRGVEVAAKEERKQKEKPTSKSKPRTKNKAAYYRGVKVSSK